MKLRSLFPIAIFFLSAGIDFSVAGEPADEESRRETIYSFGIPSAAESKNIFSGYFFDSAGNSTRAVKLLQYKSIAETESIWSRYSTDDTDNGLRAYDLSVSLDSIPEKIGFTGRNGNEYDFGFQEIGTEEPDDRQSPDNESNTTLVFEKTISIRKSNRAEILFEDSYISNLKYNNKAPDTSFAIPIALFFCSLAIGVILITFTSVENKK